MDTPRSGRTIFTVLVAALLTLGMTLPAAAIVRDGAATLEGPNLERAVILLESAATATAVGTVSGPEADAYRAQLAEERAQYRGWLNANAPQAEVLAEYDTVLNGFSVRLNGASASAIAAGPGARAVLHPTWMSPSMDESLELVNWDEAIGSVAAVAGSDVGQDVFVGIIDTGIDQLHPFFEVSAAAANESYYENEDGSCKYTNDDPNNFSDFTSCKVIIAKVFNADTSFTPEDLFGHGTHVAGTAAGNSGTDSTTGSMSGAAPAAVLGNYNVFPGDTGSASSDDIAVAVEEAVEDAMDVLNLSLGGAPGRGYDVLDLALLAAADVGVISAVAAGNSGPNPGTIESPGWTPWVLTAGASTNPHFLGQTVTSAAGTAGAAVGDFNTYPETGLTATFVDWDTLDGTGTGEACDTTGVDAAAVDGKIALIKRGTCTFTVKVRSAESLGAIGVLVSNNVAGDPVAMAHDGTEPLPAIPALMVSQTYGALMAPFSGTDATVGGPIAEQEGTPDIMAGFSSRGPIQTPDGLIIKPDMVAPGVNVNSSIPCDEDGCGFAFFQGTSMATPHLAGSAAGIIWDREWHDAFETRDEQVKSLLVNNSLDNRVTDHVTGAQLVGVNDEGSGRLELVGAFGESFFADPVAFNVGAIDRGATSGSATVALSGTVGTITAQATPPTLAGVIVEVTVDQENDTVTLTVTPTSRRINGAVEGIVTIQNGSGGEIHLAYFARIGAARGAP